jgi:drug/metabolite transporter (DMT)-like permease
VSPGADAAASASTARVVAALAVISLTWGSTYISYKQVLEVAPPLLLASSRFVIGGAILMVWAARRTEIRHSASRRQLRNAAIVAFVIFIGSTAAIVWSQQYLSSSLAGLLAGTVPLTMTVVGWIVLRERPRPLGVGGLVVGFVGILFLVGIVVPGRFPPIPVAVALLSTVAWALGSAYSRRVEMPRDPIASAGIQMVFGAAFLALVGLARGELGDVAWSSVDAEIVLWFAYLAVPCTVTYGTYVWLLHARGMTVASSFAYLSPVVAVFLGWSVLGEPIDATTLVGAASIVAGVAMVVLSPRGPKALTVSS